jgi:putative tricarboxylic transport membrane protein
MTDAARRDIPGIAGCVLAIAASALAIWHAKEFTPLGAVFPRTIAILMIVFSAVYIAVAILRPQRPARPAAGSIGRRAALAAVMLAWAFLLEPVGFLATSIASYAAILVIANYDRWTPRMAVVYTIVGAFVLGALYSIFRFALQVPLPEGILL